MRWRRLVFSLCAVLRAAILAQVTRRDDHPCRRRWKAHPVLSRGFAEMPSEAGGERSKPDQSYVEADLAHRPVGVAKQRRRSLEPTCHQVCLGRLAERATELAAEVRPRQPRRSRHVIDADRLRIAVIHEVPRPQQMPSRRHWDHTTSLHMGLKRSRGHARSGVPARSVPFCRRADRQLGASQRREGLVRRDRASQSLQRSLARRARSARRESWTAWRH